MRNIEIDEIKKIIQEVTENSLNTMNVKGLPRMLINNQIENYFNDKDNNLDIEISFYKMLEIFKKYKII